MKLSSSILSASLVPGTLAKVSSVSNTTLTPLPPSEDPWYRPPYGFEKAAPGTVLSIRQAPGNISTVPYADSVYNVLFRTTDSHYKPTWAVTTVFLPNTTNNASSGLLSYQVPYDSADVDDSPSYALYLDLTTYSEELALLLSKGWFLSIPDYEGPLASFTAGVMSGHATIDSVRAVLSLSSGCVYSRERPYCTEDGNDGSYPVNLPKAAPVALWGYSGGALASEWAAELAVQYAPELSISGIAIGGLTPNITNVMLTINGNAPAGLAPNSILGLTSQYPDAWTTVLGHLKTTGKHNMSGFLAAADYSLAESEAAFAFQNLSDYFDNGLAWLSEPSVARAIQRDGIMGYHGVPQVPLYVYKAVGDEVSPVADTDALVDRYCAMGANILYQRNSVGGHSAEGTNGLLAALGFISSLLDGTYNKTYSTEGCTIQTIVANTTDSSLRKRSIFTSHRV